MLVHWNFRIIEYSTHICVLIGAGFLASRSWMVELFLRNKFNLVEESWRINPILDICLLCTKLKGKSYHVRSLRIQRAYNYSKRSILEDGNWCINSEERHNNFLEKMQIQKQPSCGICIWNMLVKNMYGLQWNKAYSNVQILIN